MASAPRRRSAMPRDAVLAGSLVAEIERGTYAVGSLLPGELEIAERYGLSRHTTREALRRLDEMGLITRRAGIGTMVKARATESHYTASIGDLGDLIHHIQNTRLDVRAEEWVRVDGELAHLMVGAKGQRWLKFTALRYPSEGKEPISFTEIVLHPIYKRIRDQLNAPNATIFRLIEKVDGERIKELKQEISCMAAPADIAAQLGIPAGDPVLNVVRSYYGRGDALLSVSVNVYPQNRFKVTTRWRLDAHQG
jgi:GntR family transcriptional regulator